MYFAVVIFRYLLEDLLSIAKYQSGLKALLLVSVIKSDKFWIIDQVIHLNEKVVNYPQVHLLDIYDLKTGYLNISELFFQFYLTGQILLNIFINIRTKCNDRIMSFQYNRVWLTLILGFIQSLNLFYSTRYLILFARFLKL